MYFKISLLKPGFIVSVILLLACNVNLQAVQQPVKTTKVMVKKKAIAKNNINQKKSKTFATTIFTINGIKMTGAQMSLLVNPSLAKTAPKELLNSTVVVPKLGKLTIAQMLKSINNSVAKTQIAAAIKNAQKTKSNGGLK